jgi:hypothetical protein
VADVASPVANPPDQPPVPRSPRWSSASRALAAFAAVIVLGYAYVALTQYQLGSPERDEVPASVRASPGGYRSFHFWHSGYHGGK